MSQNQQVGFQRLKECRARCLAAALSISWALCGVSFAGRLDPAAWSIQQADGMGRPLSPIRFRVSQGSQPAAPGLRNLAAVVDNNLSTCLTLTNYASASNAPGLLIDLGQIGAVDRVVISGKNHQPQLWPNTYGNRTNPPLGLIVAYVGLTPQTLTNAAECTVPYDAGNPIDTEVDMRFSPVVGRYVRVELQTRVNWGVQHWPGAPLSGLPVVGDTGWNIAELEVFGSPSSSSLIKSNAVVLPAGAVEPLALAASELSYYLGELTGQPHPIIAPTETNNYSGTLYRIVDLKSLAPDYSTMTNNIAKGLLPDGVNVESDGREVVFRAWPYRCVLWSVWEFLERQGVRWVYPEAHGDWVPSGQGVRLDMLPLRFQPSAQCIFANWDTTSLQPWPVGVKQSLRQSYLYPWRNRWNYGWNGDGPLGGAEIPPLPSPATPLDASYSEGFVGYPHNFNSVLPVRVLEQHTNWWGFNPTAGSRINPTNAGATTFCMDNPDVIDWVAAKVVAVSSAAPVESSSPLTLSQFRTACNLLPMDSAAFCECSQWCRPTELPFVSHSVPWVTCYTNSLSEMYYRFVTQVASRVIASNSPATIGALAYADDFEPPSSIDSFPSNVQVEVCLYGAPNLPMSDAANAGMKQALDTWSKKCQRLGTYDYALLHTDYWQTNPCLPVPLVSGTVERARYLAQAGALNGECEATPTSLPHNPWNFYAYPRIRWNTNQTSDALLSEFFTGFYQEAAFPMLAYYKSLEQYQMTNGVDLHYQGYCYWVAPGAFPVSVLTSMETNLEAAEQLATNWFVVDRVAKARADFNWVMAQRGLSLTNLANLSSYPVVSSNASTALDLTKMQAPPNKPLGNYASLSGTKWFFGAQGQIQEALRFTQAGTYQVTVNARAVPYQGIYPILNVYAGPEKQTVTVSSTNSLNYSFSFAVPQGVWDMVLTYNNAAPGGARNIGINSVTLKRQ